MGCCQSEHFVNNKAEILFRNLYENSDYYKKKLDFYLSITSKFKKFDLDNLEESPITRLDQNTYENFLVELINQKVAAEMQEHTNIISQKKHILDNKSNYKISTDSYADQYLNSQINLLTYKLQRQIFHHHCPKKKFESSILTDLIPFMSNEYENIVNSICHITQNKEKIPINDLSEIVKKILKFSIQTTTDRIFIILNDSQTDKFLNKSFFNIQIDKDFFQDLHEWHQLFTDDNSFNLFSKKIFIELKELLISSEDENYICTKSFKCFVQKHSNIFDISKLRLDYINFFFTIRNQ